MVHEAVGLAISNLAMGAVVRKCCMIEPLVIT